MERSRSGSENLAVFQSRAKTVLKQSRNLHKREVMYPSSFHNLGISRAQGAFCANVFSRVETQGKKLSYRQCSPFWVCRPVGVGLTAQLVPPVGGRPSSGQPFLPRREGCG